VSLRKPWALYAITTHGIAIASKLLQALPDADLYVSEKLFAKVPPELRAIAKPMPLPMGPTLTATFTEYDCHVHVISVGAVVRMVAPLLQNKKVDPAIVCVDDAARFAICVLSGHVGRGNAFCDRVAAILAATSVVTTASDVRGTLTVDILGRELGWTLADVDRNVTRGCAAVVNAAPVLFVQETGEPEFWPLDRALPEGVRYATSLDGVDATAYEVLLIATDREIRETARAQWERAVVYRPKSLVIGIGCDKLTPEGLVERGVRQLLARHELAIESVRAIATIDVKKDEPALQMLTQKLNIPLLTYTAAELDAMPMATPSDTVMKHVGTRGVAEPAAQLAAGVLSPAAGSTVASATGAAPLIVPKQIYTEEGAGRSMTFAVARIPFAKRVIA
jgi:cobalt-precorrin 5A hydrolase